MNWKLAATALALGLFSFAAPGCAADSDAVDDEEAAASSEEEISATESRLVGAFHGTGGAMRPPTFQGLVFKADNTFFADVDTGVRCITTPCPSHVRVEGRFRATKSYVWFFAAPGSERSGFHGIYRYSLVGDKLALSRLGIGWSGWTNELGRELSYCGQADDCWGQDIVHPMCLGGWVCGAGINNQSANRCGWSCDYIPPPGNDIWPSDAKSLVAQNSGGGFTPPPPAGSSCALGASKYALDVAAKKVAYETCKFVDWQTPLTKQSGEKTLTDAELAKVVSAMNALELTQSQICGADKPYMTVSVSSPSQGDKTYKDSFYSCDGDGPHVDNIDGVFSAFRQVVGQ